MPENFSPFSGYSGTDEVLLLLKLKKECSCKPHLESCQADRDQTFYNFPYICRLQALEQLFQFLSLPTRAITRKRINSGVINV